MTVSIVGTIIGLMVLVFGIYYLVKEKEDKESVKMYGQQGYGQGQMNQQMIRLD